MSITFTQTKTLRTFVLGSVCFALTISAGLVQAASKAEKRKVAEELVKEALQREVYGMKSERSQLLEKAAAESPDYAPAMWHRGYVRHKNDWIKAQDCVQISADDPRMVQYTKIRGKYEDTAADQLELANWCQKRGLEGQERAHLTKVLRAEPDHAEARERLGFRRVDGEWMRAADVADTIESLKADRLALAEWRPKLEVILAGLKHRGESRRTASKERLLEIRDPGAILALESVLSIDSAENAMLALEAIAAMPQNEATLSLARHAVQSPWENVRKAAADLLKDRPKDVYVPTMLSAMYTPVQSRMELYNGPGGRMMYRHSFFREGQDENQLMVLETAYRRVAQPGGDRRDSVERALASAQINARNAEQAVMLENARTAELNTRITDSLASATGQVLPASPDAWWSWWSQYNEVFVEGNKQTRTVAQTREVNIVDQVTPNASGTGGATQGGSQQGIQGVPSYPTDCLAAGTLIWTLNGLVAVETMQAGDMVLSKDVESGELSYKPVLRTTIRPKSNLVKLMAGTETIESSGGHPFWVSGEGWMKARELKPGAELHTVNGSMQISSVDKGGEAETYNLIVADFNTYFIGEGMVLSHDNTIRETTNAIVPGLIEQ